MDMKVEIDSQDMLLRKDSTLPVSICKTCKRKSNLEYIAYVMSFAACTVACICAIYCHQVLNAITTLHESDITKHYMGYPTASAQLDKAFSHPTSPVSGTEDIIEDNSTADKDDFEVEKSDQKYPEDGGNSVQENEESAKSRNNDRFIKGPSEKLNFNAKKPLRRKRSANDEVKKCKKNCRGMNKNGRRACRKKCGGGKPNKVKSSNFIYQINLPAAHFEANSDDDTARHLVETKYNRIKLPDEGPLKIFKQAQWVKGPSPFTFSDNSVAKATSSGIFFVYAQAYIGGSEPEKSIVIVQKRNGEEISALSCDNGVNQGSKTSSQLQTCAVSGLMKLEIDDTVEIQRSEVTIKISLDKDKTFFGLVQLSGITATSQ